jgi:hypothetical protein
MLWTELDIKDKVKLKDRKASGKPFKLQVKVGRKGRRSKEQTVQTADRVQGYSFITAQHKVVNEGDRDKRVAKE